MWRRFHSIVGLLLSVLVMILAITGSILATKPVYDTITIDAVSADLSVADMLRQIHSQHPTIEGERIKRDTAGQLKFTFVLNSRRQERIVDPANGTFLAEHKEPAFYIFVKDLHRSFTFGKGGRAASALGAVAMFVLSVSGVALLVRRVGGWRQLLAPVQGKGASGLHSLVGRLLFAPLLISAFTAMWLSAVTFDIIPEGAAQAPAYPESVEELAAVLPWDLHSLQTTLIDDVDEIIFPIPGDWFDVWALKTATAYVFVDQFTGDILSRDPLPTSGIILDYIYFLHTAEGSAPWAIVLFFSSLGVPFFACTGAMIWWRNRRSGRGRIIGNASVGAAKALVLVGSESGTTWGFAKAMHKALIAAGIPTRISAMNELRRAYPNVKTIVTMSSTYGDGDAPKSATRFPKLIKRIEGNDIRHMTVAFGDKAFPDFCAFAHESDAELTKKLGPPALPVFEIDKQSAQAFSHWGGLASEALGIPLSVSYEPKRPKTQELTLIRREVFGASVGATTSILRFSGTKLARHNPGDLVEIYPPGSAVPRLYSLGSSSKADGFLEICVRKLDGGMCSTWLCGLTEGETIDVSIRQNERFQLPRRNPVVMIGAGTGIAPFTGMIRQNSKRRPLDLYWGGRHPTADWLYGREITGWLKDERLRTFEAAWSRNDPAAYVQDRMRETHAHLLGRLKAGATIMVCGGRAMATAVHTEIDILAAEIGSSADELKRRNRYLEDVY